MFKFSSITQTEDPIQFPTGSFTDSSIQQTQNNAFDLKSTHSFKEIDNNKETHYDVDPELELIHHHKNFATKYLKNKKSWCIVNLDTNEITREIGSKQELDFYNKRINIVNLSKTYACLNIYEKEIIVWIRLNYQTFIDRFDLLTEIIKEFNIGEVKANYLIDIANV